VGYIMFWPILKSMDKVAGQIDGMVDKVTSGAQKALSKYRGETMKRRWNEYKQGRRGSLENPGIFRPSSWVRRAANAANAIEDGGRPGLKSRFTRAGKAQRRALEQSRRERETLALKEEAAKFGETFSGDSQLNQTWNDVGKRGKGESKKDYRRRVEAQRLAYLKQRTINGAHAEGRRSIARQDGESDEAFEARAKAEGDRRAAQAETEWDAGTNAGYEKKKKETVEKFWDSTARMEAQAGVEAGSEHFSMLAARSAGADSTAYRSDDFASVEEADQAFARSLAKMVEDGTMDEVMAVKIFNSNKERMDRAAGFGQNMGYISGLTPKKIAEGTQEIITEAVGDPAKGIPGAPDGELAHIAKLVAAGDPKAQAAAEAEYIRRHQRKQSAATTRGNAVNQLYASRWESAEERSQDDARVARVLSHGADLVAMGDNPDPVRVAAIATELGVDPTGPAHVVQERVMARITSDMAAREDLAFDKNNIQRSIVEAQIRHLARVSNAHASMLQYAPQNRDIVDAQFLSRRMKIPTSKPVIRTTIDRNGDVIPVLDPSGRPVIATERRVARVATGRKVSTPNGAGGYDELPAMEWVDPADPSKGQRPETREEITQVPMMELRLDPSDQEMTVLDAMKLAKEDPLLAAEMRRLGYDFELAQSGRTGVIDPSVVASPPVTPPTGPPMGPPAMVP